MSTKQPSAPRVNIPTPGHVASKNRRRPMLMALAVGFILVSALAGWWAFSQISTTVAVVGVKETVTRGDVIDREDLVIMQVSADPGLSTIPADEIDNVVGRRAATDLPAGTTIPENSFTEKLLPPKGKAIVGLQLPPESVPTTGLVTGARVTLVPLGESGAAPGEGADNPAPPNSSTPPNSSAPPTTNPPAGASAPIEGTVVAVRPMSDGAFQIDVEVDTAIAPDLSRLSANKQLAVVVESQER